MDTKKLRQKILDLAIRGKLVPQDPNDEPASVLLERIRAEKEQLIKEGKIKRSKKSAATDKSHYENVPFEIPESWAWVTLSEVCEVARGGSPRPIKDYLTTNEDGVNWIKIGDTDKDGKYINSTKEKIIPEGVHRSRFVHKGDFLLTNSMSFGRPYILNIDGCIHDGWLVISPFANSYVTEFLYFLLSSSFAYDQFADAASGGVVSNLNSDKVANSYFPLPPEREQRRIINELNNWFKVVGELDKNIQGVKSFVSRIKSKILDLAISGKLVPQDPNDEPAIELLKRINPGFEPCDNSHYENLPQGWTIVGLHSVAEIITGSTPSKLNAEYYNGDVPFYKPNDLDQGRHVRCASEYLSQQGKSISRSIPCNSIAVCCIGSIGKCGFIEKEGVTNQQINTIVPNDAIFPLYMYYFCNSSTFIDELKSLSSAVTISIVNKSKLSTIQIPLPPIAEQKRIISVIEKLYSHLDMITAEL